MARNAEPVAKDSIWSLLRDRHESILSVSGFSSIPLWFLFLLHFLYGLYVLLVVVWKKNKIDGDGGPPDIVFLPHAGDRVDFRREAPLTTPPTRPPPPPSWLFLLVPWLSVVMFSPQTEMAKAAARNRREKKEAEKKSLFYWLYKYKGEKPARVIVEKKGRIKWVRERERKKSVCIIIIKRAREEETSTDREGMNERKEEIKCL